MDDDQDMADMYIGRREAAAQDSKAHRQASLASTFADDHSELGDIDEHDSGAPQSLHCNDIRLPYHCMVKCADELAYASGWNVAEGARCFKTWLVVAPRPSVTSVSNLWKSTAEASAKLSAMHVLETLLPLIKASRTHC